MHTYPVSYCRRAWGRGRDDRQGFSMSRGPFLSTSYFPLFTGTLPGGLLGRWDSSSDYTPLLLFWVSSSLFWWSICFHLFFNFFKPYRDIIDTQKSHKSNVYIVISLDILPFLMMYEDLLNLSSTLVPLGFFLFLWFYFPLLLHHNFSWNPEEEENTVCSVDHLEPVVF